MNLRSLKRHKPSPLPQLVREYRALLSRNPLVRLPIAAFLLKQNLPRTMWMEPSLLGESLQAAWRDPKAIRAIRRLLDNAPTAAPQIRPQ